MNPFDLFRLIFGNLNRRKARVALTAIGVVIGTSAIVVLVSLAFGLQKSANEQLYGIGDLTQIQVMPAYDEGMPGPGMVGGGGGEAGSGPKKPKLLTNQMLDQLRGIPGVASVVPRDYMFGQLTMKLGKLEAGGSAIGIALKDLAELDMVAVQGVTRLDKGTIVVGPLVARNFYDPKGRPGKEPPPPPDLFDQRLKFVLTKWDTQGTEIRKTLAFRVVGVLKETRGESDWSIYMNMDDVKAMNEWVQNRRINYNKDGYSQAIVKVAEVDKVLDVNNQIQEMGFQAFTPQSFLQGINNFYLIMQIIFGGVGAIALLVAAIGIANTMTMSILERTREIGLMKAIGATNRDVLAIFLGEAAGIGFIGGLGGVILGWLAGQAIDVIGMVYLASQSSQGGGPPTTLAVYTPLWLPLFALLFSTLIGLLSGLYPALRAATMIPVLALKYE